jgi:hypothetical protein
MSSNKKCKNCHSNFNKNSKELNYNLYKKFGFKNKENFRKHNARNQKCPYKRIQCNSSPIEWEDTIHTKLISEEDYTDEQNMTQLKLKKHNNGGRPLWFSTTEEAALEIVQLIVFQTIYWITLVAEPGSGKTMVAHYLIYFITSMLPYDTSISSGSITITTGMSDTEWYDQIKDNFMLRDGKFLWEELNKSTENNCIVHRSNFHKRITYLLNNQQYLTNHIFIIDESHFADASDMTIDNELVRLGLTKERMKEYNIKVIFISATPDVNLSIMDREETHYLVQLQNGEDYKGFSYYYQNKIIINDTEIKDLGIFIPSKWNDPRFHFIRARTQQEKGQYRNEIKISCENNNWELIEDDSDNNIYLSFKSDDNERKAVLQEKRVIKTYEPPEKHTIILIKNKYQASKRLKITSYTGLILEKSSKKRNATVTCNGLIPRFFGYDPIPEFNNNEKPIFACDKKSVIEYIEFSKDFKYEGKDYTSNKIKSTKNKLKEFKNTCYGELAEQTHIAYDSEIIISKPFNNIKNIDNYLLDNCGFRKAGINVRRDITFDSTKKVNKYIYPKRNVPGHTWNVQGDTFLTKEVYINKFVNKGQGNNINRKGLDGTGQCFVIYPVYENSKSDPEDVKYYVHSLKMK